MIQRAGNHIDGGVDHLDTNAENKRKRRVEKELRKIGCDRDEQGEPGGHLRYLSLAHLRSL